MAVFTKNAIIQSFLKLLNEKRLDRITVKDIVVDCGVSRKTFYYYFDDIYDLLEKVLEDLKRESVEKITNFESFEAELMKLAEFVMNNKKAVYHIYNSVSREKLEDYLYESSLPIIESTIKKKVENIKYFEDDVDILSRVCANAFTSCMLRWMKDGMSADFEHELKRIALMFEDSLQYALIRAANQK